MSHDEIKGPTAYVMKAREEVRQYAEELLGDNERLRACVTVLEADVEGLRRELSRAREEGEARRLSEERVLAATKARAAQYAEIERHNVNLANLYVAAYRLHGTLDRQSVLEAIREIIANRIGCEEYAVFETKSGGQVLELVTWSGITPTLFATVPFGEGAVGAVVASRRSYRQGRGELPCEPLPCERHLSACIPLRLGDEIVGAIATFRLLMQKPRFDSVDDELFELLAVQAATALRASQLYEAAARPALGARSP